MTRLSGAVTLLTQRTLGTAEGTSPSTLTEFGEKISKEVDGKKFAAEFALDLAPPVKGWLPYDIQEFSFNYVYDRVSEDSDFGNLVRIAAYENAVSEWAVVDVISLELRDALLELSRK